ncbi:hypothetical protein XENOCAPTIV_002390 [Xenoophorus captivus]|uniref:DEP domain-containing protein n=1 Tax=Xenoophorus captivus TaxID=1517983 RepID=A0ABV0RF59_9TELE
MPLRKHRQNFRHHASCFTASAAVEWLHQMLQCNSNFGPDVTRQQTVQLLKKFLKNHVIEDPLPPLHSLLALILYPRCSALCLHPCLHLLSVFCGNVTAPGTLQRGKRKSSDLPSVPPPAKSSFRSTECLLLSLLRQGSCDETESPMGDVLNGKLQSRVAALKEGLPSAGDSQLGYSSTRSCSLETILDHSPPLSRQQLFLSRDSLPSSSCCNDSQEKSPVFSTQESCFNSTFAFKANRVIYGNAPVVPASRKLSMASRARQSDAQMSPSLRPRSVGSCLDIVRETKEEHVGEIKWRGRAASCFNVNTPTNQHPPSLSHHSSSSHHLFSLSSDATTVQVSNFAQAPSGPNLTSSTANLWLLPAPAVVRRCFSSLDVSKPPRSVPQLPVCVAARTFQLPQPKPEHSKTFSCLHVCVV